MMRPPRDSMLLGREEEEGGDEDEEEFLLLTDMEWRPEWSAELFLEPDLSMEFELDSVARANVPKAGKVVVVAAPGVTALTPVRIGLESWEYMAGSFTMPSCTEGGAAEETGV